MKWLMMMLVLLPSLALAGDKKDAKPDPKAVEAGAKLYTEKTCVACHGKDAKTPIMADYPKLDIKSGARANGNTAAMKGVMHLVSDAEIKSLAAYLASLN
ncbi:MAG: c-type cytochrome [Myxococcaceae bacterium]|nr:c-type cytochrome [Myxococcaceae bacterium]